MLRAALGLGVLVVTGAALWLLFGPLVTVLGGPDLDVLAPKERLDATGAIRSQVAAAVGYVVAAGTLAYTIRKFALDRDKQYTDRFTKAVEQLGSTDVAVRAGGIRALERLLHECGRGEARERDRILRTVTGYLRARRLTTNESRDTSAGRPRWIEPDDITAAIATLRDRGAPKGRDILDLRGMDVGPINLSSIDLRQADLSGAQLDGVDITGAALARARLIGTSLVGADLSGAVLDHVDGAGLVLVNCIARSTDLRSCDLAGATITDADLSDARLDDAVLVRTDLRGADLRGATGLTEAQLQRSIIDPATSLPPELVH